MTAPFSDVIDESLQEATFLWGRWERELTSLTRNLDEVRSWTEDRLHGALDGVRVAGSGLVDVALPGLLSEDSRHVTVSAALLGSSADDLATEAIAGALRSADGVRLDALLRALELVGSPPVLRMAAKVLIENGPRQVGGLCRLKAFRRVAAGDEIAAAFASGDVQAQLAALRVAPHTTTPRGHACITDGINHEHPVVRSTAIEVAVGIGQRQAWEMARALAGRLDDGAAPYLKLLALLGTAEDHEIIYSALRVESLRLPALWALGHVGTPRAADACIAGMAHDRLARAAGEAYCWITGADLERDRLAIVEPLPEVPAFDEDDLDADLVPSAESLWPKPDAEAVKRHWQTRRADMAVDVRHVHGQPASHDTLVAMVETGPMLRRPDLILELRSRSRGQYDVEPRAFAARQREMMAAARRALSTGAA